jgi:hypothetical protein
LNWLERKIRRYEHARWTKDDNRRVLPFEWGLEHIGGRADDPNPREFMAHWVPETIAHSDDFFRAGRAMDYRFERVVDGRKNEGLLNFTSAVKSPWVENNKVWARFFQARKGGAAVVLLPNWNAKWEGQMLLSRWLNALGISVLKLSMPYHDRRAIPGHERADYLVGSNIGLTIQASQQAVTDTRRCLVWLAEQGYDRLGIVGISIGSAIGSITMAHEPLVRASAFLHVSTYFGDVVRTGMNTSHVWEGIRGKISGDELRFYWSPVSPMPYLWRLGGGKRSFLAVAGKHDPTFLPELTYEMFAALRASNVPHETLVLPCGHYSLELMPFGHLAAYRVGTFLMQNLA